jgi:hypothetical protein
MSGRFVAPEPFGNLIDRVLARDADYFKRHPEERVWVRAAVKGEFWPARYETATLVSVERISGNVIIRRPLSVPS